MINYKLIENNEWARKIIDGSITNEYVNCSNNIEYLEWLENGNTPLPAYTEEELAERQKFLRVTELKKLLADSDFRVTHDYYESLSTTEKQHWVSSRASWRNELRSLLQ